MLQASGKIVWLGGDFRPLLRVRFASLEGGELQFLSLYSTGEKNPGIDHSYCFINERAALTTSRVPPSLSSLQKGCLVMRFPRRRERTSH